MDDSKCCVVYFVGYANENAVHVALETVRNWLDKLTAKNQVSSEHTGYLCHCVCVNYQD